MSRRRYRRPRLFSAVLTVLVIGVLAYLVLTRITHMHGNAAVMVAGIAAGWMLRAAVRVPYIRTGWRRPR